MFFGVRNLRNQLKNILLFSKIIKTQSPKNTRWPQRFAKMACDIISNNKNEKVSTMRLCEKSAVQEYLIKLKYYVRREDESK